MLLSWLVPVAAALVAWGPLTRNFFLRDDFIHLFDARTLPAWEFVTQLWGGHLYVVRNAILLATLELFGPDPRPFFWTVLLTHVVNVVLCWAAIQRFTRDRVLACFGATLWGTCSPLDGTLGWYSVYGQVLLTTMVLAVLAGLGGLLDRDRVLTRATAALWGVLLVVGGASFGFGIGMVVVFPLVVAFLVPAHRRAAGSLLVLALAAVLVLAAYATLRANLHDGDPSGSELLSVHATLAAVPSTLAFEGYLLGVGTGALLTGLAGVDPAAHAFVAIPFWLVLALLLVTAAIRGRADDRRRLAAVAFLVVVAYATVAAGRTAVLRSTSFPLEVAATWVRYHYFPLALLVLLACLALGVLARGAAARVVHGGLIAWTIGRLVVLLVHPYAMPHNDAERTASETALARMRTLVAATPPGEVARIDNRPFPPMSLHALFPGWAALFAVYFPDDTVDGRLVRFAVSPGTMAVAERRGGRFLALVEPRTTPTTAPVP